MSGGFGAPAGPFPQQPQQPGQPGLVQAGQGGFGQGTPFSPPPGYQSSFADYGFDPGFQSYLDQRNYMGTQAQDMGQYSYDPTNQMFTLNGAYLSPGTPTPTMSLADMQNRYQNPYQPPMPINRPGKFNPYEGRPNVVQPGPNVPQGPRPGAIIDPRRPGGYNPRPQTQPFQGPQQRGLGGLQLNKFRNRLDQR